MIWEPTREFIENTNVWRMMLRLGFTDREAFLRFSREEPERFWDEMMREMRVEWFEPYHQVMDLSGGPEWSQWFIGGRGENRQQIRGSRGRGPSGTGAGGRGHGPGGRGSRA